MSQLSGIEEKLNKALVKDAPFQLPEKVKKTIVQYLPILNLVLGVITIWAAWSMWQWAHAANRLVDYANELSRALGTTEVASTSRLSVMLWIGLIVLAVEGVLYIAAYPGLKARNKSGWNLLFYVALLNLVYGVVVAFTDYGSGLGSIIGSLIGSTIGLYFLFQVRSHYTGAKSSDSSPAKKS